MYPMKKISTFCLVAFLAVNVFAYAPGDTITLDLTHPTNPDSFTFDASDIWTETYNESSYGYIESQVFAFSHLPSGNSWGGASWEGFTVSKVAEKSGYFGCMAGGGVDGAGTPYVVGYYSDYYASSAMESPNQIIFNTGELYDAVGMYVCNNPVSHNAIKEGDAFARQFVAGDYFVLQVEALDDSYLPTGLTTSFYLADYRSENPAEWTLNNSWEWFDMSALGQVGGFSFSLITTDMGAWGPNTATYFAMDKLKVSVPKTTAITDVNHLRVAVYPNPFVDYIEVTNGVDPVEIYNLAGVKLLSTTQSHIDTSNLPAGVYILKSGTQTIKIVK